MFKVMIKLDNENNWSAYGPFESTSVAELWAKENVDTEMGESFEVLPMTDEEKQAQLGMIDSSLPFG